MLCTTLQGQLTCGSGEDDFKKGFRSIVLGFNDTSTILCRLLEKGTRDRRNSRDEREGPGRKRNWNESEETEEI